MEKILRILRYPPEIEATVRKKLKDPNLVHLADTAYQGNDYDFSLCHRMPNTRLAVITYLLQDAYRAYQAKGIPETIIADTFRDVSLRATKYYQATGRAGLRRDDVIWFRHIMAANLFQIGSLQFQPFEMLYLDLETLGEPYMTFAPEAKVILPPGTPVINCHIPRGADLSPAAVDQSLREAFLLFQTSMPELSLKTVLCYSWLLYPPMVAHLPDTSRIRQFANRFEVLSSCDDHSQVWQNLFPNGKKNLCSMPTHLQLMAAAHPERFGFSCGIMMDITNLQDC